jgi:hypothetical protein
VTIQLGVALRTARASANETTIGPLPTVEIRTGPQPSTNEVADSGTLLATFALASDWATQDAGVLTFSNIPVNTTSVAGGTASHYRLKGAGGTCHMQGSVTITGGGGDMTIDNAVISPNQTIQITGWTIAEGNA